jgi:prepilin-type N-terminal cleavage/methylation domain-containing protein
MGEDAGDGAAVVTTRAIPRCGARRRGFTVLETVVGLAIATIVMTSALDGGRLPAIAATKSLDRLQATRAAISALETLDRSSLADGQHRFDPKLPGTTGHLVIRQVAALLFDVTATVRMKDGVAITENTRLVRETSR